MAKRWTNTQTAFNKNGYKDIVQFNTYKGIGHTKTDNVIADLIAFFKTNCGDKILKIEAHENGN